jgi:hypothetical protein
LEEPSYGFPGVSAAQESEVRLSALGVGARPASHDAAAAIRTGTRRPYTVP